MLEDLWTALLQLTAQFVIPDWGAIILLLPIFVAFAVVAILLWVFMRLRAADPARRGKRRIEPQTPAGIHMPGPSWAPVLASFGAFTLFLGLVFGGLMLAVGATILTITLLYWLAEAVRVYDHDLGETATALPAVVHEGPPPGVHMPGPSFRPFLGAIGAAFLMLGLVFGEWLLVAGVIALVVTLLGWLVDARKEYVKTVEADTTGHLENIPAPRTPSLLLVGLLVLFLGATVIQLGWVPPREASGGTPTASGAPSGEGGGGGAPASAEPSAPAADIVLTAQNIAFDTTTISGPADKAFTIALINKDAGIPHNVEILDPGGASVWKGEIFNGVATKVYDVPPIKGGEYKFHCTVHPNMAGTASFK
jgi:plastocyanin